MISLLDRIDYKKNQAYGGKASMLALMIDSAVSVPKGIAVSVDDFFTVINHSSIKNAVERFWKIESSIEVRKEAQRIKEFIVNCDISAIVNSVKNALASVGMNNVKLIFRSSATSEDGKAFSFAGQFLSKTGDVNDIETRIKEVWCSVFEQNVNAYVKKNLGAEHSSINCLGMGVIIQEFCDFDISGVLFSKHPVISIKNWLFVEYADEPLQKIVHGEIIPCRARINTTTKQVLYENKNGININKNNLDEIILFTNSVRKKIECEIDVEWGIVNSRVVFVQCRPITTLTVNVEDVE